MPQPADDNTAPASTLVQDSVTPRHAQPLSGGVGFEAGILAAILGVSALPRFFQLGRWCLWYDEVVTMTIARQPTLPKLLLSLKQIDATRAPLHPILLHSWLRVFGTSEFAGRAFSAVAGVAVVGVVYDLGRRLYDRTTGLWAAWLAAMCPILVQYSRETRMYMLLVLFTCLAWDFLISLREKMDATRIFGLIGCLVAIIYTHPLGLLMALAVLVALWLDQGYCQSFFGQFLHLSPWERSAEGRVRVLGRRRIEDPHPPFGHLLPVGEGDFRAIPSTPLDRSRNRLSLKLWGTMILLVGLSISPWIRNYFDHEPEFLSARPSFKLLLGMPIGFVGGNSLVLLGSVGLIIWGSIEVGSRRIFWKTPSATVPLAVWFFVPPVVLFAYSWVRHPLFGPSRYTIFVCPAYLLLIARCLTQLRPILRLPVAGFLTVLMIVTTWTTCFDPDQKADWRAASEVITELARSTNGPPPTVVVFSADPTKNVEVETARYYLGRQAIVISFEQATAILATGPDNQRPVIWFGVGERQGRAVANLPEGVSLRGANVVHHLPGVRLVSWFQPGP